MGWTRTSHTQRIIPIERIAPETELEELAKSVVETHFPRCPPSERATPLPSFRVHYEEHSPAEHLHKSTVHDLVANWVRPAD